MLPNGRTMTPIPIQVNKAARKSIDRHTHFGLRRRPSEVPPPVRETVWARDDWFEQFGFVHLSIYGRGAVADGTHAESDGLTLNVTVVHAYGAKQSVKQYKLYAEIVPSHSMMLITEKKVELVLKQLHREKWNKLCYDGGEDGAICDGGDDDDGAFLLDPADEAAEDDE
ncbi:hypothetical protein niasHS_006379 [Heterodera schachtii]|uniref:CS domain-containing protein n=2 Tax=Heterodera TaxID=34509 RepID=A0ABD2I688_9BILA